MKRTPTRMTTAISRLLLIALLAHASPPLAAQSQQRDRRVSAQRPAAATPTSAPPPPALRQTPPPTPTPVIVAPPQTPTPTPTPASPVVAPRTLEELRARIREIVARPEFAASHLALKITSLDTGRVLYEESAQKWMQPASNMKLYTVAAALDRFGPDYRFVTSVYATMRPDRAGALKGDLIIYGRGDPSYATRFNPEGEEQKNYYRAIDELATRIVEAGVRRVEGDLVGDESYFNGGELPPGWEWDDLQWWYGAEVSALTVNDNSLDLSVKPRARVGDPCLINIGPATPLVTIVDRTKTTPRGAPRELVVHRPLGQNTLEITGTMPVDDRGFAASVAVTRPALLFVSMLRASLERRGVVFTGRTRTIDALGRADGSPLEVSALVELATRQSPPLSLIAAQTLKPSQNLYTELLLRALGKATSVDAKKTSEQSGIEAVKAFLGRAGIDAGRVQMLDGSGLSRGNLVTAETTAQLLVYMSRHRDAAVFRDALPVAGIDGTLRNRMKNTVAMGNVRAKTGTLSSATSLSGYVLTAAGERLAFSLMINNPPRETDPRAGFTDTVATLLASFTGRS
jgi:D-alanyl-D-alanine carboxypeptidase/D-alanyl-D-alanine-endopeptidase (penicillin-binding protein 4)